VAAGYGVGPRMPRRNDRKETTAQKTALKRPNQIPLATKKNETKARRPASTPHAKYSFGPNSIGVLLDLAMG
jgi:hypothetical protein